MDGIHYYTLQHVRFFSYNYYTSLLTPIELDLEQDFHGNACVDTFATHILDAK